MGTGDIDAMTEFSILTAESEILPLENVLDLRISEIVYDKKEMNKLLGLSEVSPNSIKTFTTVDFFINETKHTDLKHGYDPQFDTIFCFKNTVDDFYLKYLSQEFINVEVFALKGQGKKTTEKIGEAKLPLEFLLTNNQGHQIQSITCQSPQGITINLGKIYFRARMRRPLDEAISRWRMKMDINDKQTDEMKRINDQIGYNASRGKNSQKKIFEVSIKKCASLKRADGFDSKMMLPFFSYDFYTFSYRSPTANGNNPVFDITKRYELDYNQELSDYFKTQMLKIDFIDESVDLDTDKDPIDYIGSARVDLKALLSQDSLRATLPIINHKNLQMGQVEIILRYYNSNVKPLDEIDSKSTMGRGGAMQSEVIQAEVMMVIADRMAAQALEQIDSVLDPMFLKS